MAELFDDRPKEQPTKEVVADKPAPEEPASMEQLEQDLKSILSEISQLGQNSTKERETSWQNTKKSPAVRLSSIDKATPVVTPEEPTKPDPKFCHSCGASYPDRHTVKFCCQCGARRLFN